MIVGSYRGHIAHWRVSRVCVWFQIVGWGIFLGTVSRVGARPHMAHDRRPFSPFLLPPSLAASPTALVTQVSHASHALHATRLHATTLATRSPRAAHASSVMLAASHMVALLQLPLLPLAHAALAQLPPSPSSASPSPSPRPASMVTTAASHMVGTQYNMHSNRVESSRVDEDV